MAKGGFLLLVALVPGLSVAACGNEPPVPEMPGFEADILPLTLSRCVRCHGGGGMLNADPEAAPPYSSAPYNGFFYSYDPIPSCMAGIGNNMPCQGFAYYAGAGRSAFDSYFPPGQPAKMPPAPAPKLTDRERKLLDNWIAEGPTPLR